MRGWLPRSFPCGGRRGLWKADTLRLLGQMQGGVSFKVWGEVSASHSSQLRQDLRVRLSLEEPAVGPDQPGNKPRLRIHGPLQATTQVPYGLLHRASRRAHKGCCSPEEGELHEGTL